MGRKKQQHNKEKKKVFCAPASDEKEGQAVTTGIDFISSLKENEENVLKGRNSEGLKGASELVRESRNTSFLCNLPKDV